MICSSLSHLIGVPCYLLSKRASVAMIEPPYIFPDGEAISLYVERLSEQLRLFDDGAVLLRLIAQRGCAEGEKLTLELKTIDLGSGVSLTQTGEVELWTSDRDAEAAFNQYLSALDKISQWSTYSSSISDPYFRSPQV